MTLKVRYIRCKRPNCRVCATSEGHGPYVYKLVRDGKKRKHIYVCAMRKHDLANCEICGKRFVKKTSWHVFCSRKCSNKAYWDRRRAYPELHGKEFQEEIKKRKEQNNEVATQEQEPPTGPTV